jgi:hypothetical protein
VAGFEVDPHRVYFVIQTIQICAEQEDYSGAGINVLYRAGIVDERIDPQILQIDTDF